MVGAAKARFLLAACWALGLACCLGAAPGGGTPKTIHPVLRAKMLVALVAIVLLGFALVALVVAGGRFARRYVRRPPQTRHVGQDKWYAKPLVDTRPDEGDEPRQDAG